VSKGFVVDITQEAITTAQIQNSSHCMIADSIKKSLGGLRPVVDIATIRWTDAETGDRYYALTPGYAQQAIIQFDQGILPEPFTLRVRPYQVIKKRVRQPEGTPKKRQKRKVAARNPRAKSAKQFSGSRPNVEIEGGSPPPIGALSNRAGATGARRTFGLRLAGRVAVKETP